MIKMVSRSVRKSLKYFGQVSKHYGPNVSLDENTHLLLAYFYEKCGKQAVKQFWYLMLSERQWCGRLTSEDCDFKISFLMRTPTVLKYNHVNCALDYFKY